MAEDDFLTRCEDAALALAGERPWRDVALRDIADRAGVPLDDVYGRATSKTDIIDALAQRFDRAAAKELDLEPDASVRERVFDAAMARFDAMEPYRAGLTSIFNDVRRDPSLAAHGWGMGQRSARWLLELAGVDTAGASGFARVQGFTVILGRAVDAWRKDDAGDLARTMAALDRDLRDAEARLSRWPFKKTKRTSQEEPQPRDDGPAGAADAPLDP